MGWHGDWGRLQPANAGALQGDDQEKHHPLLLRVLAQALEVEPSAILDFDLNLCDTQPGTLFGARPAPCSGRRSTRTPPPACRLGQPCVGDPPPQTLC